VQCPVEGAILAAVTHEADTIRISGLPCWRGTVQVAPLVGGMTNRNYLVEDSVGKHVVRLGEDVPHHHLLRWHELAVSRAAHAAGLSPEVEYAEPGALVLGFLEARTLTPEEVRGPARLPAIVDLLKRCHRELPLHLHGPTLTFWPFQVVRSYGAALRARGSSWAHRLPGFLSLNEDLERHLTRAPFAFGHNDLLAGNLLDDGQRLWLIDWDYAGYSTPLFDLANLATNNGMSGASEIALLESYFEGPIDDSLFRSYRAMRVVSLLRETMWGMVSELFPAKEFDYASYTRENLERLEDEITRYRAD
jgi:thiamine kinase-like enzyme